MYEAAKPHSALALAQMFLENKYATTGKIIQPGDFNPLSLRPWEADPEYPKGLVPGAKGTIIASDGGKFLIFEHPAYCVAEWKRRLFDRPEYKNGVYTKATTLEQMLNTYAPAGDVHPVTGVDNADSGYVTTVEIMLRKFVELESGAMAPPKETPMSGFNIGNRPLRIAIGTGHANNSGGNSFETAINKKVTNEVIKLLRRSRGFDVRCYTPNDGLGHFPASLDRAAATVKEWWQAGWQADILHEVHQEGIPNNSSIRGGFFIYPDSKGLSGRKAGGEDFDRDVYEAAGEMAKILVRAYGGVTRYNPSRGMSEQETGVGGQGYRLGLFGAWSESYLMENTCRFISEGATYTNPTDLAMMQRPDFPAKQARGIVEAYAYLAKAKGNWTYDYAIGEGATPQPQPEKQYAERVPIEAIQALQDIPAGKRDPVTAVDGGDFAYVNAKIFFPAGTKILQYANAGAAEVRHPVTEAEAAEGIYIPYVFRADDGELYAYNWWASRIPLTGAKM